MATVSSGVSPALRREFYSAAQEAIASGRLAAADIEHLRAFAGRMGQ
jgi:hypothetical protein